MKKCPNCNQIFSDDNDFCLNDGTPLISDNTSQPTLIVNTPASTAQPFNHAALGPSTGSSNMLYLVIGVLATTLVGIAAYAFLLRDTGSGKADEMGYSAWLADRGRSFKNLLNVVAENRSVTIEGDTRSASRDLC